MNKHHYRFLAIVALHAVLSALTWLLLFGYNWKHPDDRGGLVWAISTVGHYATSVPILWLFGFGGPANRLFVHAWPLVILLNSLLAVTLLWLGIAAVQRAVDHRG